MLTHPIDAEAAKFYTWFGFIASPLREQQLLLLLKDARRWVRWLLSQPALGKLVGIDGQSVARWGKTSKVPRWADKLVRLLYTAQAKGSEPIAKAVERLQTVARRLAAAAGKPLPGAQC